MKIIIRFMDRENYMVSTPMKISMTDPASFDRLGRLIYLKLLSSPNPHISLVRLLVEEGEDHE